MAGGKTMMETVVRLMGEIDPSLAKSMKAAQAQFKKINKTAVAVNGAFIAMGAVAVKATVEMGKQLYELGKEFDKAYDIIRVNTGATGEALQKLKADFKDVYSSVPTTMEEASKTVADYNTRLGLTGDVLSSLSKQAIAVSSMLGDDLNATVEASSQAFKQWNIPANEMNRLMDYSFRVSQQTGMSFSRLMATMKTSGPSLQQLGFSFEQSAAMMGQMEKAGISTDVALKAMQKSVGVFAKEGLNASKGLQVYQKAIFEAKSETEAIALASEVFGSKAGSTMANAIRKGALQIDKFTQSLNASDETIMKALWDTADATEKSKLLTQQMQTAVEPLASDIFDAAAALIPILQNTLVPLIQFMVKHLNILIPIFATILGQLTTFSIIKSVSTMLQLFGLANIQATFASQGFAAALSAVWKAMLTNPIGWIVGLIALLVMNWDTVCNVMSKVKDIMLKVWDAAKDVFGKLGSFIKEHFIDILLTALGPIGAIIRGIQKIGGGLSSMQEVKNSDIPKLAAGGFTNGVSIAGEAGQEAVISFLPQYRNDNIATWLKAGELLGVSSSGNTSNSYNLGGFTFAPVINGSGLSKQELISALKESEGEMIDFLEDILDRKTATSYANYSPSY